MTEKYIERRLAAVVKRMGGYALKFVSPGFAGMPDRLIILPGGKVLFAEIKRPGKKPRPLQKARHEMLKRLGFFVYVFDNVDFMHEILKHLGD